MIPSRMIFLPLQVNKTCLDITKTIITRMDAPLNFHFTFGYNLSQHQPKWRNRQTRTTQNRVPKGMRVRFPPSALGDMKTTRRKAFTGGFINNNIQILLCLYLRHRLSEDIESGGSFDMLLYRTELSRAYQRWKILFREAFRNLYF
jgi:hypothetical protein